MAWKNNTKKPPPGRSFKDRRLDDHHCAGAVDFFFKTSCNSGYNLDLPPTQDASDHQDYDISSRESL